MEDRQYIKFIEYNTGLKGEDAEYLSAYCMFKNIGTTDEEELYTLSTNYNTKKNIITDGRDEILIKIEDDALEETKEWVIEHCAEFSPRDLSYFLPIDEEAIEAIQGTRNANETIRQLLQSENALDNFTDDMMSAEDWHSWLDVDLGFNFRNYIYFNKEVYLFYYR